MSSGNSPVRSISAARGAICSSRELPNRVAEEDLLLGQPVGRADGLRHSRIVAAGPSGTAIGGITQATYRPAAHSLLRFRQR